MAKYRKKPDTIEAVNIGQILWDSANHWNTLPKWVIKAYDEGKLIFCPNELRIITLEGTMLGYPNDMLILGVAGEWYPCKREIFAETYEYVG